METRFELTFEDFAAGINAAQLGQRQTGFEAKTSRYAVLVLLVSVIGIVAFLLWQTFERREGFNFDLHDVLESQSGPWIILGALAIVQMQAPHLSRRATIAGLLVTAAIGCSLVISSAFLGIRPASHWFFVWTIVGIWWWGFWRALVTNTSHRAIWRKATNMHGPKLLKWSHDAFSISDPVSELSYKWTGLRMAGNTFADPAVDIRLCVLHNPETRF